MLNNKFDCNKVSSFESLSTSQKGDIENFINGLIQGAFAYKDSFAVSDLVGGRFTDWSHTPLDYIYQYHKNRKDCRNPEGEAGKDVGRIFKFIMASDKYRKYEIAGIVQRKYPSNLYKLV